MMNTNVGIQQGIQNLEVFQNGQKVYQMKKVVIMMVNVTVVGVMMKNVQH